MAHESRVGADKIFFGGNIFTLDESCPRVEAVAVSGNKISALGPLSYVMQFVEESTEIIYLNKQSLFPGFIEAHQHAILRAFLSTRCVDIGAFYFQTADEVINTINSKVNKALSTDAVHANSWCIFYGWDPELFPNLPKLNAEFINTEFSALVPIIISTQSFHSSWANHKVFELIDTADLCVCRGDSYAERQRGNFTGHIIEGNLALIYKALSLTEDEMRKALLETWRNYSSLGFTTITEMAYLPQDSTDKIIKQITAGPDCPIRLALYQSVAPGVKCGEIHQLISPDVDRLWVAGVKLWADGSPHTGTIAVREPILCSTLAEYLSFPPPPNYGRLNYDTQSLQVAIEHYSALVAQIAVHTQGERAVEQVLGIYERIHAEKGNYSRQRLEHLGLVTERQLVRCGLVGASLSLFVYHLHYYATTFSESILGQARTDRWAPLASALKHNRYISIHQDNPATSGPPQALLNIQTAVMRCEKGREDITYGSEERISVQEAIKAYTVGPAWQLFMEDKIGSLKVGKFADFVILSDSPYEKKPQDFDGIKVIETYCGGQCNHISTLRQVNFNKFNILEH